MVTASEGGMGLGLSIAQSLINQHGGLVECTSEPGATLWVDNEKIDVHDDGRFYAVVRLRQEGVNDLNLRAQDTAGNESRIKRQAHVEMF